MIRVIKYMTIYLFIYLFVFVTWMIQGHLGKQFLFAKTNEDCGLIIRAIN
jgi:hypothetical protein